MSAYLLANTGKADIFIIEYTKSMSRKCAFLYMDFLRKKDDIPTRFPYVRLY